MVTKYISGNNTGDYNCDGINDDVEINAAFAWANSNPGTVIYFKGPFKYVISNKIQVGSSVTVTGDSTACISLKANAGWAVGVPLFGNRNISISNVEFYGFEIDGNDTHQTEERGTSYYMNIYFTNFSNCSVHDMYIHDSLADGFRVKTGSNARCYNNIFKRLGHEGSYFEYTVGGEVYGNYTEIRTNSAHRLKDTSGVSIHDNTMKPYALNSIAGNPGIQIEDSTGDTFNIEIYNNTLTDCWGEGIWVIEYGNGNSNRNKNLYIHDNTIKNCGRITTINYNAGITMQGFHGARIENNIIDGCYNAGILCINAPLASSVIYLTNNVIKNTKKTLSSTYLVSNAAWTGDGIVNKYPSSYTMVLVGNSVTDSAGPDNYYNVDHSNDKKDASDPHYNPPAPYAPVDTGFDYYVEGRTAYINGYPFNWTDKKIDVSKTMGQLKSPGVDGWSLEDFGFGGADITLDCYAESFVDMRQAIAAFYQEGRSTLELGGIYAGYQITGYAHDHSTNLRLSEQSFEHNYPYSIGFTADKPIMESVAPKVRGRFVTSSADEWASDNIFTGNLVSNFDFEGWSNVKIGMSWDVGATPSTDENEWRSVCWSPELNLFAAVAQTGTNNRVMTSPDGITWTRQTLSNANANQQWRCICWSPDLGLFAAVSISGTGYRVMTSPDGVNWSQRTTPVDNSWISACWTGDFLAGTTTVGTDPTGIAINAAGTKVYVANYNTNNVSVINTSTNTVSATITVGTGPRKVAVSPDGAKVYVTNSTAGTVSVITTSTNTVTATVTVGANPRGIAVSPDGAKVYVCNRGASDNGTTVSVIATSTNTVTATITVGTAPTDVVFLPDGSKAYVTSIVSNTISVITVSTNAVASTITDVGPGICAITATPDGSKIYATVIGSSSDGNLLRVIDTTTDAVSDTVEVGINPQGIAVTPDGTKVYVTSYGTTINGTTVSVVNVASGQVVNTLTGLAAPHGIAIGNKSLYVANVNGDNVSCIRLGRFIAVAVTGTGNRVMTSLDGITWTIGTSAGDYNWTSVTWSPQLKLAVAVAYGGAGDTPVMTSPDGLAWTLRTLSNANRAQQWDSVCWSSTLSLFCAVSENGTTQQVMTSPDGITWTAQTTPFSTGRGFRGVIWAHELGIFVAIAITGTADRCMYSTNGTSWISSPTPINDNNLFGIAWSSSLSMFAAVAATGTADRAITSSDYGTLQTRNIAPDNWTLLSTGQEMTTESAYSGTRSYLINGNGIDDNIGGISQNAFIEPGVYYVLAARGKVSDLTQGKLEIDIYSGSMIIASIQFSENTDWALKSTYFHFDTIPSDAIIRVIGLGIVNDGAKLYADYITLQRVADHELFTLGNDITTEGSVNCTPEITVSAAPLVGGAPTGGTIDTTDPNVFSCISTSYLIQATYTISGKLWKKFRLDTITTLMKTSASSAYAYLRVTIQAASKYGGAETQIKEWYTNSTSYASGTLNPNLTCETNETLTIRVYLRTTVANTRVYVDNFRYVYTEIGSTASVTNVKIYNKADPLNVLWAANNLYPGATMAIKSDQTGYFKYKEDFDDATYASVIYDTSGTVTYSATTKRLTLGSNAYITYGFDTRYPVTGVPFIYMFVNAGSPFVYIAEDNGGAPGTFYAVDDNSDTDVANQWVAYNLDNQTYLRLKGDTIWYVRIKSPSEQTVSMSRLYIYTDILTVDAEALQIFATGSANTFVVTMDNDAPLEITLAYRDAHMVI